MTNDHGLPLQHTTNQCLQQFILMLNQLCIGFERPRRLDERHHLRRRAHGRHLDVALADRALRQFELRHLFPRTEKVFADFGKIVE